MVAGQAGRKRIGADERVGSEYEHGRVAHADGTGQREYGAAGCARWDTSGAGDVCSAACGWVERKCGCGCGCHVCELSRGEWDSERADRGISDAQLQRGGWVSEPG